MSALLIVGAGGQGRVVAFTARSAGVWGEMAFLDDRFPDLTSVDGLAVVGRFDAAAELRERYPHAVVALGDGRLRLLLVERLRGQGFHLPAVVHPTAVVADGVSLGEGTVVFANCVVHPGTVLGDGCIVNTAATIDHDCRLGRGVHVAPGAHLGGHVTVGDFAWLGVGASIKNGVDIGSEVTVGCGAAVVSDLAGGVTAAGVPARVMQIVADEVPVADTGPMDAPREGRP